jgi:hypothetical protein
VPDDLPEEVVRGQEHQVPAEVPVAGDDVVLAGRHVLVVAGEDDDLVGAGERAAGARGLEVGVGEDVDVLARPREPLEERQVVAAEVVRDAAVQERPAELDGVHAPLRVPAPAVAQVVGLPGQRGEDDRDAVLAEPARADDEGREPDAAVGGGEAGEVEAGGPVADPHRHEPAAARGADGAQPGDGHALHLVVPARRHGLGADAEELHRDPADAVEDPKRGDAARPVALARERGLDGRDELGLCGDAALELFGVDVGEHPHARQGEERDGEEEESAAVEVVRCGSHAATVSRSPNRPLTARQQAANGPWSTAGDGARTCS